LIWLLRDFDLLSVLARAAMLSFEALLLGGIFFLWNVARRAGASTAVIDSCRRGVRAAAIAMASTETLSLFLSSAQLVAGVGLGFKELVTTGFFVAGTIAVFSSAALWICARLRNPKATVAMLPFGLLVLACVVSASHAVARMEQRSLLAVLTALHHIGTAAWIGAMPFFLLGLMNAASVQEARQLTRRYSRMAMWSVAALIVAGMGMAWFYVGSWNGLYGTMYGVLLLAKIYLLLVMASLGFANWQVARRLEDDPEPLLVRIRRFAEVEVGLGFTAVLAAASLTAQPPAVDVSTPDRLTPHQIYARLSPEVPRMKSPPADALTPATPMDVAIRESQFQPMAASDARDRAWSEYNHHWAGVVVLLAGLLAWLSRLPGLRWTRFWPLSFAGLAVFILLRADPENWPLGPRPFWESFSAPDVLVHRLAALLILSFAVFECLVQADKLRPRWPSYVFPLMCVLGSALLLVHDHAVADVKEELFAGMSHTAIALCGATAGWGRWLELRLPKNQAARFAGYVWPVFLAFTGLILLNYREM
jgi:putative copper resistance protein D